MIGAFEKSHPNIVIDEVNETWTGTYVEYLRMKDAVGEFPHLWRCMNAAVRRCRLASGNPRGFNGYA